MGQPETVRMKLDPAVEAVRVYLMLEQMAPDLLRINPYAAETAVLAMIRMEKSLKALWL